MKFISLNVDDVGLSKLHWFKIPYCPRWLKKLIVYFFDILDSWRVSRIKRLASYYGLPVTWAVVPYYLDIYSREKIRFDQALPKMYALIKSYVKQGDEVIQHGNCHFFPNDKVLDNEEFCAKNQSLSLEEQRALLEEGWNALLRMKLKPKKIIQFPCWKADDNSIKALIQLNYKAVLAGNFLYPQKILELRQAILNLRSSYQTKLDSIDLQAILQDDDTVNLAMHPSPKNEFENLRKLLALTKEKKVKFVTVSQALGAC